MDYIFDNMGEWKNRLVNNSVKSFGEMTLQRWIRIIAIIGAYLILRPYLLKGAASRQKKALNKEAEELGLGPRSEPNANDFRDGKSSSTIKDESAKPAEWGQKAKKRQRKAAEKKEQSAHEEQSAESDREIEQYLID